jgi:glycosyltransferase involved in cell wall biosynthesis
MTVRVLMVVEQLRRPLAGGIGRYASGLIDGLTGRAAAPGGGTGDDRPAAEVELLASRAPRTSGGRVTAADPLARWGLPVHASPLPGPLLTRAWDRGLLTAPQGFEVVHAVSLAGPPVRPGRGPGGRAPALVVTVHDLAWHAFPDSTTRRGRRWHEAALRRALRRADALLVPSETVAEELLASGARRDTVSILQWGVDHLPPPDRRGAQALLRRLGVDGPYLLSASTREPRKNLHRLVAAYAAARPSLPEPWPMVVVGPRGWGNSDLGIDANPGSPVPEGVVATGHVSDEMLAGLYEGARVFAYVPLTEGYGLPPMEAMTFGVPVVVSTTVPSADPGPGAAAPALRVDPQSTEAIADALVQAAVDESVRSALAERGLALTATRTWHRVARRHVELWQSLA